MKIEVLQPQFVETMPETLESGILYISEKYKTAIHLCACGCGLETVTPFCREVFPHQWGLVKEADGTITLDGSVGNFNYPCKSHYFVKHNRIEWC